MEKIQKERNMRNDNSLAIFWNNSLNFIEIDAFYVVVSKETVTHTHIENKQRKQTLTNFRFYTK